MTALLGPSLPPEAAPPYVLNPPRLRPLPIRAARSPGSQAHLFLVGCEAPQLSSKEASGSILRSSEILKKYEARPGWCCYFALSPSYPEPRTVSFRARQNPYLKAAMGACLCLANRRGNEDLANGASFVRLGDSDSRGSRGSSGSSGSGSKQRSPAGVCISTRSCSREGGTAAIPVLHAAAAAVPTTDSAFSNSCNEQRLPLPTRHDGHAPSHAPQALSLDDASVLRPALTKASFCPSALSSEQSESGGAFAAQHVKEGWLLKRSQRGIWHRRWFRTHNAYLHYFRSKAEADVATGDGRADMIGAAIDLRRVTAIEVVCDGGSSADGCGAVRLPFSPLGTVLRLTFQQRDGSILAAAGGSSSRGRIPQGLQGCRSSGPRSSGSGRSCLTLKAPTPASALAWKTALKARQAAANGSSEQTDQQTQHALGMQCSSRVPLGVSSRGNVIAGTTVGHRHCSPLASADCRTLSFSTPSPRAAAAACGMSE